MSRTFSTRWLTLGLADGVVDTWVDDCIDMILPPCCSADVTATDALSVSLSRGIREPDIRRRNGRGGARASFREDEWAYRAPRAPTTASQIRSGVSGVSRWRTP